MITLPRVQVGQLNFEHPLVLGPGICKTLEDVRLACVKSAVSGIELGTITPQMRAGNSGKVFIAVRGKRGDLLYTLNSLGMPNPGRDNVTMWAAEAIKVAHDAGKLIGINVAGDTPEEIVTMVVWAASLGFDWVTINAGCPNKWKLVNDIQVPEAILSFDTGDMVQLLELLERTGVKMPVWWKPSPENDTLGRFVNHANLIGQSSVINGWVANNTTPHCFAVDPADGKSIAPGNGLAGMGGPAVKPKALGDLRRLLHILPPYFSLIGVGGITDGSDIIDYSPTADLMMFTSAYWAAGMDHRVAQEMLAEHAELLLGKPMA